MYKKDRIHFNKVPLLALMSLIIYSLNLQYKF